MFNNFFQYLANRITVCTQIQEDVDSLLRYLRSEHYQPLEPTIEGDHISQQFEHNGEIITITRATGEASITHSRLKER